MIHIGSDSNTVAANELERMAISHFRCELACFILSVAAIHTSMLIPLWWSSFLVAVLFSDWEPSFVRQELSDVVEIQLLQRTNRDFLTHYQNDLLKSRVDEAMVKRTERLSFRIPGSPTTLLVDGSSPHLICCSKFQGHGCRFPPPPSDYGICPSHHDHPSGMP